MEKTENQQPVVSIIMPAYNAETTLVPAVESALAQSFRNFELIIVNDRSTDTTPALIDELSRRDSRIRPLHNDANTGPSHSRYRAAQAARGQWLAFLDSDDLWTADKLEAQLAFTEQADLIFTASAFIDHQGNQRDWTLHVPETISYRKLLKQNIISNSSVLLRRELYLEHACLEAGLHEDFVCWMRLLRAGAVARGIDQPLLIYRLSPHSKSGNKLKAAKMNWRAYRAAGLNVADAAWNMVFYTVNSLLKYRHLK